MNSYLELQNLSDEEILNLYDDVVDINFKLSANIIYCPDTGRVYYQNSSQECGSYLWPAGEVRECWPSNFCYQTGVCDLSTLTSCTYNCRVGGNPSANCDVGVVELTHDLYCIKAD